MEQLLIKGQKDFVLYLFYLRIKRNPMNDGIKDRNIFSLTFPLKISLSFSNIGTVGSAREFPIRSENQAKQKNRQWVAVENSEIRKNKGERVCEHAKNLSFCILFI